MRCCKKGSFLAWAAIGLGAVILSALILPRWFWWLMCGAALLTGGVLLMKKQV